MLFLIAKSYTLILYLLIIGLTLIATNKFSLTWSKYGIGTPAPILLQTVPIINQLIKPVSPIFKHAQNSLIVDQIFGSLKYTWCI